MNILKIDYINVKLQEFRVAYYELRKEQDQINEKINRLTYKALCYDETHRMLKAGISKNEIINTFKITLNKDRSQLKYYEGLFGKGSAFQVGTPAYSKRLEVEERQNFMEDEIFKYL